MMNRLTTMLCEQFKQAIEKFGRLVEKILEETDMSKMEGLSHERRLQNHHVLANIKENRVSPNGYREVLQL